ncbi:MAG: V-type ATP synthase subunit I [Prevotellaceae bacterium]|jgi:V/A-type H+-transporting ATPase subunit I|nr:V-type ATP synthase subunit I [Prevotellaceae bacterium]
MMKYSMIVFYKDYQPFLQQLQELGLVDVTVSSWKANNEERNLVEKINHYRQAAQQLKSIAAEQKNKQNHAKNLTPEKALEIYQSAREKLAKLKTELDKTSKEADELAAWGDFDANYIEALKKAGITLHFYELSEKRFEEFKNRWNEKYSITEINSIDKKTCFVIAAPTSESFEFDLPELKPPAMTYRQARENISQIAAEIENQQNIINRSIAYIDDFIAESECLSDNLHLSKAANSGEEAAEGKLILLEGWATAESQREVENLLNASSAFFIKEKPAPDDNTPVKLKNNRFARLFEFIEQFYTLPKYGTTDMTPYCAPFYIFFFGFCLCDGGYGMIFLMLGLLIAKKMKNAVVRSLGWLAFWCGLSTLMFGIATGSFFGVSIGNFQLLEPYRDMFLESQNLFYFAIATGVVHLLLAMGIKAYGKAKYFGFPHALSTIGWMLVLISLITAKLAVPKLGLTIPFGSEIFWSAMGLGLFFMFFCNSPGKNPLANFGAGLWNTYNDVTGILGDTLSYLRLFALGLSGSVLAMVFNSLATGMSPDIIVAKQLVMIIILTIGHALNLGMSALGAFVHPMRLTFVEFYKNAGFEAGQRAFTPLKKSSASLRKEVKQPLE